ncbi:MAG: phytanoyl-CoA dioxygenase [Proteobacteria bacterium]|nr:MAG: phytanoyl-CoA dioxygenase [Pseudomonadota bacterium]
MLGSNEITAFHRNGFVVVRGHTPIEQVALFRKLASRDVHEGIGPAEYEADLHYPGAPASRSAPGGGTARRLLQAYARYPAMRDWATSAAVAQPLRQLLGGRVMLSQSHHNCVMTKQPHYSSATGWHQDIRYWSFQRPELISVWLALGTERPENGGLWLLPATHVMEFARNRLDEALFLREDLPDNKTLIDTRVPCTLAPGDALFFHCRTFHTAGANHTMAPKLSVVFTYHAADNVPLPGTRSASLPSVAL